MKHLKKFKDDLSKKDGKRKASHTHDKKKARLKHESRTHKNTRQYLNEEE